MVHRMSLESSSEVLNAIEGVGSILFLTSHDVSNDEICSKLISNGSPNECSLLGILLDDTPDDKINTWRRHISELPNEIGFIAVGETTRSVVATSTSGQSSMPVSVDTVNDPADLTGLAMAISTYLESWSQSDTTPIVCFDSITSLLYHADEKQIFRFLHTINGRLRDDGAISHYHLDPMAHDEETINLFSALVDAVIDVDESGSIVLNKRR